MKKRVVFFVLLFSSMLANAQNVDTLKQVIATCKNDTNKVNTLLELAYASNFIESVLINIKALELALKLNYTLGVVVSYNQLGDAYWYHSDFDKAQDN
ncbi:MAG: hypothetical protein H7331_10810 [Bacteroidia bacterium]|nr:hypothetical protein [Bacteroidia bacterium]